MKLLLTMVFALMLLGATGDNHNYTPTVLTDAHGNASISLNQYQRGSYKISQWSCAVFSSDDNNLYYYAWDDGTTITQTSSVYSCHFTDPVIYMTGKPYTFYTLDLTTYE